MGQFIKIADVVGLRTELNGKVPVTRLISTTSPILIDLTNSADLSIDRTISILQSGISSDGYLSSIDWNAFNSKLDNVSGQDHSSLSNLAYADAGHTGFSPDTHNHDSAYEPIGEAAAEVAAHELAYDHTDLHAQYSDAETATSIGTLINGADGKTTPADADTVALSDSADLWILKKLTWANIKATLKSYFDTLYTAIGGREVLTGSRTYYVRTDGNDGNDGLTNTSGGAFLTIQRAVDEYQSLDCNGQAVIIYVADGTYSAGASITSRIGGGPLTIQGNPTTPSNVVISTGGVAFNITGHPPGSPIAINGFKTIAAIHILASNGPNVAVGAVDFGAGSVHLYAASHGVITQDGSPYTISGSASIHALSEGGAGIVLTSPTVTITGTPAFSFFAYSSKVAFIRFVSGTVWSGSATGKRYLIEGNAIIDTGGQSDTWLPGDTAGENYTGGEYY